MFFGEFAGQATAARSRAAKRVAIKMTETAAANNQPAPEPNERGSGTLSHPPAGVPGAISDRELGPLERQEFDLILKTLREEKGAIRRTAARLGISHQSLLRRLNKWPELRAAEIDSTG